MVYHHKPQIPCLHCQPHGYIRMVQHLIERCLMFRMTRDDCVIALAEHASVRPAVTITVWDELMKENRSFFQAYNLAFHCPNYFTDPNERMNFRREELGDDGKVFRFNYWTTPARI